MKYIDLERSYLTLVSKKADRQPIQKKKTSKKEKPKGWIFDKN